MSLLLATLAACAPGDTERPPPVPADPADPAQKAGTVCPDPRHPCPGFRPHDLSFVLPADGVARAEVESEPFFAILLRSAPACSISERDRGAVQAAFPDRKVFAHRFNCEDDVENNVTYTGVNGELAFMAVFAGRTRAEANAALADIQRAGAFPGANLRHMQVRFVYP